MSSGGFKSFRNDSSEPNSANNKLDKNKMFVINRNAVQFATKTETTDQILKEVVVNEM